MCKIKNKLNLLLLLSLTTSSVYAEIKETNLMSEALSNVSPGDVVVFDIDNTISEPLQTLGSDQWYGYKHDRYQKLGFEENRAIDLAIEECGKIARVTKVKPVETHTPELIKQLQQNHVMVIALTARPVEWEDLTAKQLRSIGVQFQSYGFEYSDQQTIDFNNGIIFVGPRNNKGIVLDQFFKKLNIKPNKLIFVDDKEKHVKNMEAIFSERGIPNTNFRYSATDLKVKSFSPRIAERQWKYFVEHNGDLLTDEEADQWNEDRMNSICKNGDYQYYIHIETQSTFAFADVYDYTNNQLGRHTCRLSCTPGHGSSFECYSANPGFSYLFAENHDGLLTYTVRPNSYYGHNNPDIYDCTWTSDTIELPTLPNANCGDW